LQGVPKLNQVQKLKAALAKISFWVGELKKKVGIKMRIFQASCEEKTA